MTHSAPKLVMRRWSHSTRFMKKFLFRRGHREREPG
jgi:hypothetical protein